MNMTYLYGGAPAGEGRLGVVHDADGLVHVVLLICRVVLLAQGAAVDAAVPAW